MRQSSGHPRIRTSSQQSPVAKPLRRLHENHGNLSVGVAFGISWSIALLLSVMEYLAASMRTNRKLDKIEDEKKKNNCLKLS